ncbi:MAG: SCO family protein [Chitinophagales bacterium]|nr:SCO family protein [Chitinophagales bacterium]
MVDFFFTSCPSICPVMTKNMLKLHDHIAVDDVAFLSISIDPKRDSIQKLDRYANKIGINSNEKWHFVTAAKDSVLNWATDLMVVAFENDSIPGGFEHSGYFILIDKKQRDKGVL